MINAEAFLSSLVSAGPVLEQCINVASGDYPEIPLSAVHFLNHGCSVVPVLSHSLSASIKQSMVGIPTSDRANLASLARQHPNCNWAVGTGNGFLILEVNTQLAMPVLKMLSGDDWGWRETVRFRCGDLYFFVFRHSGRRVRFLGSRFSGLKIHWTGSVVLLPSSWFVYGPPVVRVSELDAEVLDAPFWLLDPSETPEHISVVDQLESVERTAQESVVA